MTLRSLIGTFTYIIYKYRHKSELLHGTSCVLIKVKNNDLLILGHGNIHVVTKWIVVVTLGTSLHPGV